MFKFYNNEEKDFKHINCSKIVITKQTKVKRALVDTIIASPFEILLTIVENILQTEKKTTMK